MVERIICTYQGGSNPVTIAAIPEEETLPNVLRNTSASPPPNTTLENSLHANEEAQSYSPRMPKYTPY